MNIKTLSDELLLKILNECKSEYYHLEGYGVDIQYFFTNQDKKYHHTEYYCDNFNSCNWYAPPEDILGKIIHMDEVSDEVSSRGLNNAI